MPRNRRLLPLFCAATLLALGACGGPPEAEDGQEGRSSEGARTAAAEGAGPTADLRYPELPDTLATLTRRLVASQGGADAWRRTRFLRFRWIVERDGKVLADRSHAWDRFTGRYRVAYRRDGGQRVHALFDVDRMKSDTVPAAGDVWVGGRKLEGAARDSALQKAYAAFINDSYWLLMPLKWTDPGVHLSFEGTTELPDGQSYPTVHLTFDPELGVTNDEYWGYLDPESGRMVAWRYHLQGQEEKGPVIWWRDWRDVGTVTLALDRRFASGDTRIHFQDVRADSVAPDSVFRPPAAG